MDAIVLNLRADNSPPADAPTGGELSSAEIDANFSNLKTACEQLDAEKLSASDAVEISASKATPVDADGLFLVDSEDADEVKNTTVGAIRAPLVTRLDGIDDTIGGIETILASI